MKNLVNKTISWIASACYDNTAQHKANVSALTIVEEVMNYDYKTGYPNKLEFK